MPTHGLDIATCLSSHTIAFLSNSFANGRAASDSEARESGCGTSAALVQPSACLAPSNNLLAVRSQAPNIAAKVVQLCPCHAQTRMQ